MAADPTIFLHGRGRRARRRRLQDQRRAAGAVPRPRHEHADLRERLHRASRSACRSRACARSSRSCSRLPADGRRRDRQRAAEVPLHVGRPVHAPRHGALDRRRRPAASGRSTRRPASRGSWPCPACSSRRRGRRPARTACSARRSATTIRCSSSSTRACTAARGRSAAATAQIAEIGKARSCARAADVTIVATLLMVDRALRAADAARGGGHRRRGHRPALAPPARPADSCARRSRRPAGS